MQVRRREGGPVSVNGPAARFARIRASARSRTGFRLTGSLTDTFSLRAVTTRSLFPHSPNGAKASRLALPHRSG